MAGRLPLLVLALLAAAACAGDPQPPPRAVADTAPASDDFPTLPDSLVLTTPGGATIWFAGARVGTDSTGGTCLERGLVIVHDSTRTLVPLLMTGAAPVLVNDTTIRARIWLHCVPGNTYEVNVRTGAPTRVK